MNKNTIIKGKRKTNRVEFVRALKANSHNLRESATIDLWCEVLESSFGLLGMKVYCHKSNQNSLPIYARIMNEWDKYEAADFHCDVQHDISKLNRDTDDPSLANTDPMFPRDSQWIFFNDVNNSKIKCIDSRQLEKVAMHCQTIKVNRSGLFVSGDGHICKSSPEYVIEEWLIRHNIPHLKEGDIDEATGKRATEYPFDRDLNPGRRSIEADWELYPGKFTYKIIVEYFEGKGYEGYTEKVSRKRALAEKFGLILIELWRRDLYEETFRLKFKDLIAG